MEKKALIIMVLILALLSSAVAGTQLVKVGRANPFHKYHYYIHKGGVAPDENTEPPAISIFSPQNDTVFGVDVVSLSLKVRIGDSSTASSCYLSRVYYDTDWQSNRSYVYNYVHDRDSVGYYTESSYPGFYETINLTGIPDGNHTITIYAVEMGRYELYVELVDMWDVNHYYNSFTITGSSSVRFSVDTTRPMVSVSSPENMTYFSPETLLNFTVSEKSSRMVYSLDGQGNVTINGNVTLNELPYGLHNVTVYATDEAGNTGASETIVFTIEEPPEPFPTMIMAPIASVAFVGVGLMVYLKRKR